MRFSDSPALGPLIKGLATGGTRAELGRRGWREPIVLMEASRREACVGEKARRRGEELAGPCEG